MARTATTKEEFERQLRIGLVPAVDDVSLLRELGFEQLYPHLRDGYHETLWGRQVDVDATRGGARQRAIQRAVLELDEAA